MIDQKKPAQILLEDSIPVSVLVGFVWAVTITLDHYKDVPGQVTELFCVVFVFMAACNLFLMLVVIYPLFLLLGKVFDS